MAAQLGQGFQAKDTEDGARIGAAASEIETVEDHGRTAAEDPLLSEGVVDVDGFLVEAPISGLRAGQPPARAPDRQGRSKRCTTTVVVYLL